MPQTETKTNDLPQCVTPRFIADVLSIPLHRVLRILATRHHIQPAGRAGSIRVYRKEAVAMVRHELNAQDARRSKGASHA